MSSPGPASPGVLSLHGVSKAFGAVQALRDVSLDCRAGEIHALVGENGSGKSTLLGIASGFLAPDEGTVVVGETERRRVSPAESRELGLGIEVSPNAPAGALSLAERQLLEVVKALLAQPKVLLLDEPTTALGPEDVERLHALVFEQSRAGV